MENYQVIGLRIGCCYSNGGFNINIQHTEKVRKLADTYGYNLEQRNGQRIFGPPMNWSAEEPSIKSEIFIGHIPKGIFEDTLVPLFANYGTIYKFRLMMDFSGENRGFGFCLYDNELSATVANMKLDNFEIMPGKKIGVMGTEENNSLIISDVPFRHNIREMLFRHTDGIVDMKYQNGLGGYINLLVRYADHRSSALARRFLMNNASNLFNTSRIVMVDWAKRSTRLQAYLNNKHFKGLDSVENLNDTKNNYELNNNHVIANNNEQAYNNYTKHNNEAFVNINQVNNSERAVNDQILHNFVPNTFNLINNNGIVNQKNLDYANNNLGQINFIGTTNCIQPNFAPNRLETSIVNLGRDYNFAPRNHSLNANHNNKFVLQNQAKDFNQIRHSYRSSKQYGRSSQFDFDRDSLESSPGSCDESI